MTDKITQSLINSCKKLYNNKVISYENYLKCTKEMQDKETYESDSELKTNYTNKRNTLVAEKENIYKIYETRVKGLVEKLKNSENVKENYTGLVNDLKKQIKVYETNFSGVEENKDLLYTEMLNRNKELADKTDSLNKQLNEIETMNDKNNNIQSKMSQNVIVNKSIMIIIFLSIIFICYKFFTYKPQQIISV